MIEVEDDDHGDHEDEAAEPAAETSSEQQNEEAPNTEGKSKSVEAFLAHFC